MTTALPVSRVVNVSVTLTPAGAQAQNLRTLLILSGGLIIDVVERYRSYSSLAAVAADFGTSAPEYLAALLWFQQSPQPATLQIGRWAQTATAGVLRGGPLSGAQQALANFTAVASGGFTYSKDGGAPTSITGINLSAVTNLNGVATAVTAALGGPVCVWNANFGRFEITSATTGATSAISFLTAPGAGTDISSLLGLRSTNSGSYVANGIVAESAVAAITLFDLNYSQQWYAAFVIGASDADHQAIAPYIEAATNKHVYGVSHQEAGALVASTTTDISYLLSQVGYKHTFVQYSSTSPYAVVSLLARILTVDYTANNSAITVAIKQEPGITAEVINTTQADSLKAKNTNAFLAFENSTAIILNGVASDGTFIDIVTGTDNLAIDLQVALYNLLYTSTTKIPQTDAGMNLLLTTAEGVMVRYVNNGFLAPGVWNSGGVGIVKQGDFLPKGFYVYAAPVATQNAALRAARQAMPLQILAKLAGAIQGISVAVLVNQ